MKMVDYQLARQKTLNDLAVGFLNGVVVHRGGLTKAAIYATLDIAEAKGKATIVWFPPATYDVVDTLSLSGYSCQIRGAGAGMQNSTTPAGTVFYASAQAGPVLDFKGWVSPNEFSGRVRHGDFAIRGSGIADATKANIGLRVDFCQSTAFCDIAIMNTGGPGLKLTADVAGLACYLSDFERITIRTPISAKANDVPYFHSIEANGNRFRGIGFISRLSSADCGVSGAMVITGSASYSAGINEFDAIWFENQHIPDNGCLISHSGTGNRLQGFQFFDVKKESGASATYYLKLLPGTATNFGGNHIDFEIPGDNGGTATDPDFGIWVNQPYNRIEGVKGYKGNNVVLNTAVHHMYVHLKGSVSGASTAGIVDNSGTFTNHLIDEYNATEVLPSAWTTNTGSLYLIYGLTSVDLAFNAFYASQVRTSFEVTLGASIALTAIDNAVTGTSYVVLVKQDTTGSRLLTWPANIKWTGGTAPTLTTTASRYDVFEFFYDGTNFRELSRSLNQT